VRKGTVPKGQAAEPQFFSPPVVSHHLKDIGFGIVKKPPLMFLAVAHPLAESFCIHTYTRCESAHLWA